MSVTITTYSISEDNHVLTPTLTPIQNNLSAVHKENTNMLHPTLILSGSVTQTFNYIYITEYGRYYFLKERTFSQQKYICTFDVDPLRSWSSEVSALSVIANRSSSRFNVYQPDNSIPFLQKTTTILGTVDTVELSGTYEITENDDGTKEIAFTFENEDEEIKSGTFTFEEGEDYIKIGLAKYTKKA